MVCRGQGHGVVKQQSSKKAKVKKALLNFSLKNDQACPTSRNTKSLHHD